MKEFVNADSNPRRRTWGAELRTMLSEAVGDQLNITPLSDHLKRILVSVSRLPYVSSYCAGSSPRRAMVQTAARRRRKTR